MYSIAWNQLVDDILSKGVLPVTMKAEAEMPTRARPQVITAYADGIFPVRDMSCLPHSRKSVYYKQGNEV
ncbi:hypothetical protein [Pseudomonas phage vB_PaeM_PS119XW]|uniref:Uncharacterized protein n=1 Tax=Pseudomonas phage vB_PaeM_PS119XW TaxID=2601632 RepID=A0A5C1K7Z9_9CAUD|nr:hypothetical protein PP933_gp357 [Pseudomonas phage vB_PaeM_PS119XW]QEM42086.1 hypothetical protein [Pseudomonas phage vB_PaeM_PS119XW]